ncbi:MAG TPA: outer membrane beta-barrel protein [Candidatus Kapabacteria bacterium]|nr:outer membrane beta-barrel protein [Candidatus Kapabacteria bacterium]
MKHILTLFSFFLCISLSVLAQSLENDVQKSQTDKDIQAAKDLIKQPLTGYAGLSFTTGNPQHGSFQEFSENNSFGFGLKGGYYFNPIPLTVGMNVDFLFFGGDEKTLPRTILGLRVNDTLETSTTMVPILFHTRFQPQITHFLFPYIEVSGGASIYSSNSELRPYGNSRISNSETDIIWMYGIGAGLQFRLVDFVELPSSHSALLLDIYARYLFGEQQSLSKAKIIDDKSEFVSSSVKTDILSIGIGVSWMF